jgi:plastocyanin
MQRIALSIAVGALSCAAALVAHGSTGAQSQTSAVTIDNYAFSPAEITVPVGSTVTWTQMQTTDVHTATSTDGLWDSNVLNVGASFSFQFTTAGDFAYDCSVHPDLMTGIVHVR